MKTYSVTIDGEEFLIGLQEGQVVMVNGEPAGSVAVTQTARDQYSVLVDGTSTTVAATGSGGELEAFSMARRYTVQVVSERERYRKRLATVAHVVPKTEIRAPMPALVVKVEVQRGDTVKKGQGLVILEAMKMENEIKAHIEGVVKEVRVEAGKVVEKDEVLILLE